MVLQTSAISTKVVRSRQIMVMFLNKEFLDIWYVRGVRKTLESIKNLKFLAWAAGKRVVNCERKRCT